MHSPDSSSSPDRDSPAVGGAAVEAWTENVGFLLNACPHTIRSREGGGAENLIQSLVLTFNAMQHRLTTAAASLPAGKLVAGSVWREAEEEGEVWTAEVQTIGGYNVIATVHGGSKAEAMARRDAIMQTLAALSLPAAPADAGVQGELREAVTRVRDSIAEFIECARLRGDNDLPHPCDDPKLWTARMTDAWGELEAIADDDPLAALATPEPSPTPPERDARGVEVAFDSLPAAIRYMHEHGPVDGSVWVLTHPNGDWSVYNHARSNAISAAFARPPAAVERGSRIKALSERLLTHMREIARQDGWALAVHGSMTRDLDVIAVPWTNDASGEAAFVEAMRAAVARELSEPAFVGAGEDGRTVGFKSKPHGRRCWTLHGNSEQLVEDEQGAHPYVDLAIMDIRATPAAVGVPAGMKLVPVEPTGAMKSAGLQELPWGQNSPETARRCWAAMLAAAPDPGVAGEGK